jgi:endonuclease-3
VKKSATTGATVKPRARAILSRLRQEYPQARCSLDYRNPLELLIATILSAQCTDERVNQVTPVLFSRFPQAADYARADRAEIEELIRSTGFFRNKAKSIQGACQKIVADFGGRVPETMEDLLSLPGVARKTANVVLGNAFGRATGVVVDTHVFRLAGRMGFSRGKNPSLVERDLMELFPQEDWVALGHILIHHGRAVCTARRAECGRCAVEKLCPQVGVSRRAGAGRAPKPPRPPLKQRIAARRAAKGPPQ